MVCGFFSLEKNSLSAEVRREIWIVLEKKKQERKDSDENCFNKTNVWSK